MIKRGSIYWVDLNPTIGSEINDLRPCVIISNDIANERLNTVTVIPVTASQVEKVRPYEALIPVGVLKKESKVKTNQIRTIDKIRLRELAVARLDDDIIQKIEKALKIHLGLPINLLE